jgi:uncharacterized protein DUF5047
MRTVSSAWPVLLHHSHRVITRVDSYLGVAQLLANLPIKTGTITYDDTGKLRRRLALTVPAHTSTMDLDPAGDPGAPLACYGQRLHVATGLGYPNGAQELCDHGWYLLTSWKRGDDNDATITIEGFDLAQLLDDDRLTAPSSPPAGASFASEFARLLDGLMPAVIPAGFPDRPVSTTTVWERERLDALATLCAAWPARWYVGDDGAAHVDYPYTAVTDTTPINLTLTDGVAGTVVNRARGGERAALYNCVVVDGRQPDDGSARPHAVSEITDSTSPIRTAGPYGRVVRFYESDLITTQPQAQATADAMLVAYSSAGRSESVTAVPDPSIQLGDVARIYTRDGNAFTGRITAIALPLTVDGGAMTLDIGMPPQEET